MKRTIKTATAMFAAIASVLLQHAVHAGEDTRHVVELFTSQSCYSCPPAEELLGKIVGQRKDVLALEFHVDYWNDLVYGSAGQWQDPYSSAQFTERQRAYRLLGLKGRPGVYTPQMIVDGRYAFVGSRQSTARKQMNAKSNLVLDVSAQKTADGSVLIEVTGEHDGGADIWLVTYDRKQVTEIPSGENKGKTLENYNIVRSLESIGRWSGEAVTLNTAQLTLTSNQNCAVLVQKYDNHTRSVGGPIIGAADCSRA